MLCSSFHRDAGIVPSVIRINIDVLLLHYVIDCISDRTHFWLGTWKSGLRDEVTLEDYTTLILYMNLGSTTRIFQKTELPIRILHPSGGRERSSRSSVFLLSRVCHKL